MTDPNVAAARRRTLAIRSMTRAAMAGRTGNNATGHFALKILRERQAEVDRLADPFEQARIFLGRRGYAVYNRKVVLEDPAGGWQVGRRVLPDRDAVIALAAELGWGQAA